MRIIYFAEQLALCLALIASGCVSSKQLITDNWLAEIQPIPLSDWGPAEMARPDNMDSMKKIKRITVHHDGFDIEPIETDAQILKRVKAVRTLHQKRFADIGYHFIVDPKGRVWNGRPLEFQGAHAGGHNKYNVGILVLGNYEHDKKPTDDALKGLYDLIRRIMQTYNIKPKKIFTHCEFNESTKCPGRQLQLEMDKARMKGGPLNPDT